MEEAEKPEIGAKEKEKEKGKKGKKKGKEKGQPERRGCDSVYYEVEADYDLFYSVLEVNENP